MRSLVLLEATFSPTRQPHHHLVATTIDPATDETYFVLQRESDDDHEILLEVCRADSRKNSSEHALLTTWSTFPLAHQPRPSSTSPFVVSLKYLPEDDALVVVLSNGDIEQIFLNGGVGEPVRENVGTFDEGIKAAEWSPDDELLAIVNGADVLLTLTKTFDPLSESPLHTASFGVDAPVSVGWGAKSTQFHGSLGKTAAATAAANDPLLTRERLLGPIDEGRIRIRWRGDATWFAVSSIESVPPRAGFETQEAERPIRRIRIFSRVGTELSSTSLPVASLEEALDWMPSGELIASSQDLGVENGEEGRKQVVFFERNGLRRYEFEVREKGIVRDVKWNSSSDVLAVWIEKPDSMHTVHLYHRSNYHWYLKQAIMPRLSSSSSLFGFQWHPEKSLELSLVTRDGLERHTLGWDTLRSTRSAEVGQDDATVAVIDGGNTKLTPFRLVNVPPPMCGLTLPTSSTPVHIAFAPSHAHRKLSSTPPLLLAFLYPTCVDVYSWSLSLVGNAQAKAREGLPAPKLVFSKPLPSIARSVAKQCAIVETDGGRVVVGILRTVSDEESAIRDEVVMVREGESESQRILVMEGAKRIVGKLGRRNAGEADKNKDESEDEVEDDAFVVETDEGWLLETPTYAQTEDLAVPSADLCPLPEFCPQIEVVFLPASSSVSNRFRAVVGLASSGRLYTSSRVIATDATSFATTPDFLIYTTFSHEAKFVPLATLSPTYSGPATVDHSEPFARRATGGAGGIGESETPAIKRALERGSRIVAVAPSSTSLVLQMPRGNLETICPRPLVLRVVRDFLDSRRFRSAFLLCRKHRIDLNLLYDHNPTFFKAHLTEFVDQVRDVDHLNLFLSGLKDEDVTQTMYHDVLGIGSSRSSSVASTSATINKIKTICDLVREDLEKRDMFHYANSILTAHVRKQPPAYEDALKLLAELKDRDAERAEDAVKYIIFLSDANKLFDLALGMYDFALVLMIAQHSQKDPREYLPFLRALRELPDALQKFKIDDHLSRHTSALRNLSSAGPEHFEEALEYTKKHSLFGVALEAFGHDEDKYKVVLEANAEDLFDRSKYAEAGLLFSLSGHLDKAILAYQHANAWQELFTVAVEAGTSADEIKDLAVETAERLASRRRYADAARVLLEYGKDLDGAVSAFCEGNLYAEAMRLTALEQRPELVDAHVKPSTLEMQQRLLDDFSDVTEQLEKQADRLGELRQRRDQNPYQYYCIDDPSAALENLEIAPDGVSDAGTAFTRYTVNPTTIASSQRSSSKTARSRKRAGLKKAAGKKGSVYEEMYLLNSIKKSVETKLAELQAEVAALLPVLLRLSTSDHRDAATELHADLSAFEKFLTSVTDRIWSPLEKEWRAEREQEQEVRDKGDALLLAEWEARPRPIEGENETKRVERPELAKVKWRIGMLDS
ncbi:hypothetical protein JCM10212_001851 [Sporobolomyces blumeae]